MMVQVCVERDAVAIGQLVAVPVAMQEHRPALDERGLPAARLVPGRVAVATRDRAGGQDVARELGALAG